MKRSEKLFRQSGREAVMVLTMISATVCAGVWSVRAWQAAPGWGACVAAVALTGLLLACTMTCEALRLFRMAVDEALYEYEREVRPRL